MPSGIGGAVQRQRAGMREELIFRVVHIIINLSAVSSFVGRDKPPALPEVKRMSENNTARPFDRRFLSLVRHFLLWLLRAASPVALLVLWFHALAAFPGDGATRTVCAAAGLLLVWLIPFVFSFERTGIIPLDILACLIEEAVILAVLFFAMLVSAFTKDSVIHSDDFLAVLMLLGIYSLVVMLVNFFVTGRRQQGRKKRKEAPAEEHSGGGTTD